jgi:hypothetical protein
MYEVRAYITSESEERAYRVEAAERYGVEPGRLALGFRFRNSSSSSRVCGLVRSTVLVVPLTVVDQLACRLSDDA